MPAVLAEVCRARPSCQSCTPDAHLQISQSKHCPCLPYPVIPYPWYRVVRVLLRRKDTDDRRTCGDASECSAVCKEGVLEFENISSLLKNAIFDHIISAQKAAYSMRSWNIKLPCFLSALSSSIYQIDIFHEQLRVPLTLHLRQTHVHLGFRFFY